MGLHISRLALAVTLSLHLAVPLQAADQLDEFYTEIKGPDAAPSPLLAPKPKPVTQTAPMRAPKANIERQRGVEPTPQPFAVAQAEGESIRSYGPVKAADTLWSIAERMRPSRSVSVHQTMLAIYRSNPSAFAGGRLNGLYRGVRLAIPAQAQIQAESEAEAQTLLRQGKTSLTALPVATTRSQRVVKLSPKSESAAASEVATPPTPKPVVKLTPDNPGISAAEPVAEVATHAPSAAEPATTEMISSKLTIPSQPANASAAVDASVSALVADVGASQAETTALNTQGQAEWQVQYQSEIAALNVSNQQLHTQVEQLSKQLDEIKSLLAQQANTRGASIPATPTAEPQVVSTAVLSEVATTPEVTAEAKPVAAVGPDKEEGFFSQLFANPINLGLLITLPILLILALVSLLLRAKAKREMTSRQEEESGSADMLADDDSHFDHLMAADMVVLGDLPDLEQKDETLQPQPEIVLGERTEPSFQLPDVDLSQPEGSESGNRIGKASGWGNTADPQLVPEVAGADLGLNEPDLDLATDSQVGGEASANTLDEDDFLAELGVSLQESQPQVTDSSSWPEEPEQPELVPAADNFQPRESVNLSNDELEALFNSVEEHDAAEFLAPVGATSIPEPMLVEAEAEAEPELSLPTAEHTSEEEQVLSQHMAELLVPEHDEAPAANWYNENELALDLPVSQEADDALQTKEQLAVATTGFKGIDELLAEAEASADKDEPYQGLSFDVGLDEFPEVLPGQQGVDVDADGGIGAKLDLARAYLEIDDKPSAIELLNEVLAEGSGEQQVEAERLLKRLV